MGECSRPQKLRVVARYPLFNMLSPSIQGPRAVDLPVCGAYAVAGAAMRRILLLGGLLGKAALAFDRLMLDRLKVGPMNGELFVIKGGVT